MILQSLVQLYERKAADGTIAQPGWAQVKVSYALAIDSQGQILDAVSVKTERAEGKKTVLRPQIMDSLPAPAKRSLSVVPNFLCDNSTYLLGADERGNPERTRRCFEACRELHVKLLADLESPPAKALLEFYRTWDPQTAGDNPALKKVWKDITSGCSIVFRFNGAYIHLDPAVREAWQKYYKSSETGPEMVCLATGEKGHAARVHPAIKGVQGTQASGAALVSFNTEASCSYGQTQCLNAPVSRYAAFAYTTALNQLLADTSRVLHIGDTTVVCWSAGGDTAYQDVFKAYFQNPYTEPELIDKVKTLLAGKPVSFDSRLVDPEEPFFVLGLAPNIARISVRFFERNSFRAVLSNVSAHYERMEIVRPAFDSREVLSPAQMLAETVNLNSRDKLPAPKLAGEVMYSILSNTPYPAGLISSINLRIRADRRVNRGRAAVIKAYYLKRPHPDIPEEVLTVDLNNECTDVPYTLGRVFSLLETIQEIANPGLVSTIRDKFFNSASSFPASVFPVLVNLAQKHLQKLDTGYAVYYEKQLTQLMASLGKEYPEHLTLQQQGAFQLGYYFQTQARYKRREER